MHVHLPKPLHGWRAFVGEVGIIVIGVLIALGAEQVVESIHSHHRSMLAREALRSELADDNLPQAYARIAMSPCLDAQLAQLQSAFDGHVARVKFAELAKHYFPPLRTWDDQAWTAVVATGDLSRGGASELIRWSLPYRIVARMGRTNEDERQWLVNLHSISSDAGPMTAAERDRETEALEHLRSLSTNMSDSSRILLAYGHEAGVDLTRSQQEQVLREVRSSWGRCATAPSHLQFDIHSQSRTLAVAQPAR